ncbi:MAG TPA: hypothetical protein VGB30_02005 [bacterium]|jgi:hypothetical protein
MTTGYFLPFLIILFSVTPVFGQNNQVTNIEDLYEQREIESIQNLLGRFEASFNNRDIDARMALCLDSYQEYAFEFGRVQHMRDYDTVKRETAGYWRSIRSMSYSLDEIEINLSGPMAQVRASTTHLTETDRHRSVVNFSLLKINGRWWIAWDSYNIIRRYEE